MPFISLTAMSKRAANILEASLSPIPGVDEFVFALVQWHANLNVPANVDPVHGVLFATKSQAPKGTRGTEMAAVRSLLQFADLCKSKSANYPNLDDFMVGWGRWVIDPNHLFDTTAAREECVQQRAELARIAFFYDVLPSL